MDVSTVMKPSTPRSMRMCEYVSSIETRPIIQLASSLEDSLLGVLGNRSGCSSFVQHCGTGPLSESHPLGYHLQGYRLGLFSRPLFLRFHAAIVPDCP